MIKPKYIVGYKTSDGAYGFFDEMYNTLKAAKAAVEDSYDPGDQFTIYEASEILKSEKITNIRWLDKDSEK